MTFMTNKFPRILHFPYSPGAKNDDRIAGEDYFDFLKDKELVFLEKIDGQNQCLNKDGVFARTHAVVDKNPWSTFLWPIWDTIKTDLADLEIFGENMYAIHSITYNRLNSYFYVFAVRENGIWKSWSDVKFIAEYFNFNIVPEYYKHSFLYNDCLSFFKNGKQESKETLLKDTIYQCMKIPNLGNTVEGVVVRIVNEFNDPTDSTMAYNVLKYVRKNHVQTDEHWTRNWSKAELYSTTKTDLRESFRNSVFSRDSFKCIFCRNTENLDAHHITDRHQFKNGGYVIENGITLCNEHHLLAEQFHVDNNKCDNKYSPAELYKIINSNYEFAKIKDSLI